MANGALTSKRLDNLYKLENEWRDMALDQTIKCVDDIKAGQMKVKSLFDKLSSEIMEMERALLYNIGSLSNKYEHDVVDETGDVINMAQILLPIFLNPGKLNGESVPPYSQMIVSIHYHKERYGRGIPLNLSSGKSRKELFKKYIRTLERKSNNMGEGGSYKGQLEEQRLFHENYLMLHHDIDEYLDINRFKSWSLNMESKWTRMMGDTITNSISIYRMSEHVPFDTQAETPDNILKKFEDKSGCVQHNFSYERLYKGAIDKMRKRDKRYHGINRRDLTDQLGKR